MRKANSIEQFRQGLETVRNYLSLKGPLDDNTNQYLISLNECAQELISIRKNNSSSIEKKNKKKFIEKWKNELKNHERIKRFL